MHKKIIILLFTLIPALSIAAPEKLFVDIGPPNATNLPEHVTQAKSVRVNRRALQSPRVEIELFGETVYAIRTRVENHKQGEIIWVGHLEGRATDSVIVTIKGAAFSGMIQKGEQVFRIGGGPGGSSRLMEVDLRSLPQEDLEGLPDGFGDPGATADTTSDSVAAENVQQDLLVAYTQAACNYAGGCSQLEADIATAVADINVAYSESGVAITMNLVGMMFTDYAEPSSSSTALNDLRTSGDGIMDDVHTERDNLGADLVALVYNGPGCGIGYLGSSASTAFSVTDVPCLVGNRTMAHEIGHNQGAHHDRVTVGGGLSGSYNYGYRRCNDTSVDGLGAPYFRTVLAYPCSGSPRVGRFSNPNVSYSGVPQGVDPAVDAGKAAWNARTLNESASYVAGFRNGGQQSTPPAAPSNLAIGTVRFDQIDLSWNDNANNESAYIVEQSVGGAAYSVVASLAANVTSYSVNGLNEQTAYSFRVKARNSTGDSGYSNIAAAVTPAAPSVVEDFAQGENIETGTVNGSYTNTHADDGIAQTISETGSGGPKRRRKQAYAYTWIFDVTGGPGGVSLSANSWVSGAEAAVFEYSTNFGVSWLPMFVVDENSQGAMQSFLLPPATQGSVWVRASDAEKTNGEGVDSLMVDYLAMSSFQQIATPPASPTNLAVVSVVAGNIGFTFEDQADNEVGFEVRRAESDPGSDCAAGTVISTLGGNGNTGSVAFSDDSVASNTVYWYSVRAFNSGGNSASCTNIVSVVSAIGGDITLNTAGYKDKGLQKAALTWSGATSANVIVLRDGALIATTPNDGQYLDNIDQKGGGSYRYQICEQDAPSICSLEQTVTF